jgi:teichuronic acid biosynthesis glycosyltransferase TuaC
MPQNPLKVLCFTTQFPFTKYSRDWDYCCPSHFQLARLARVRLVSPLPWPRRLRAPHDPASGRPRVLKIHRPLYYYPPGIMRSWHGRFLFWSAWPTLKRIHGRHGSQVMFASFAFPEGYACMLAARRLGLPYVIKTFGTDLMELQYVPGTVPLVKQALRNAAQVIGVSRGLREKAVELGVDADRSHWVPNGVDQVLFKPRDRRAARAELGLEQDAAYLVFVGDLREVKGIPVLLKALRMTPRVKLLLVGGGGLENSLKAMADELRIADRVIWAGRRLLDEVPTYMAAADCLVLPSKSEGEPSVTIEALAAGRPVVASRVGGVPDIVKDRGNGRVVEPGDPDALAEAIGWTLGRQWDPMALRASVEHRTWEKTAQGYLEILNKAAGA